MSTAQDNNIQTSTTSDNTVNPAAVAGATVSKEHEQPISAAETAQPISHEIEIPPEVEKVCVRVTRETIELPPDIKKLGVAPSGAAAPAAKIAAIPAVVLPISDDKVITGLHVQILSSLHWLAVWCMKKLKKAHIMLKVIHGKIIRVKKD